MGESNRSLQLKSSMTYLINEIQCDLLVQVEVNTQMIISFTWIMRHSDIIICLGLYSLRPDLKLDIFKVVLCVRTQNGALHIIDLSIIFSFFHYFLFPPFCHSFFFTHFQYQYCPDLRRFLTRYKTLNIDIHGFERYTPSIPSRSSSPSPISPSNIMAYSDNLTQPLKSKT